MDGLIVTQAISKAGHFQKYSPTGTVSQHTVRLALPASQTSLTQTRKLANLTSHS